MDRVSLLLVGRRFAASGAVLIAISMVSFSLVYLSPGDPLDSFLRANRSSIETRDALYAELGLDRSVPEQYALWLGRVASGNLGRSFIGNVDVATGIRDAAAVSVPLGIMAFLWVITLGVPLGVLAAVRHRRRTDRAVSTISLIGYSTPAFAMGIFMLYIFGLQLRWFPVFGAGDGVLDRIHHLILPSLTLAMVSFAIIVRLTRASLIGTLEQDYISFARARGISETRVIFAYGLRNSLIPVVTAGGLLFAALVTGAIVTESLYSLPGLGRMFIQAIQRQDLPVIQALTLVVAAVVVITNWVVDVIHVLIDPRMRLPAVSA